MAYHGQGERSPQGLDLRSKNSLALSVESMDATLKLNCMQFEKIEIFSYLCVALARPGDYEPKPGAM